MRFHVCLACGLGATGLATAGAQAQQTENFPESLKKLELEELKEIEVSKATRIPAPPVEAPVGADAITRGKPTTNSNGTVACASDRDADTPPR